MVPHMSAGVLKMVASARKTGNRQSPSIPPVGRIELSPYLLMASVPAKACASARIFFAEWPVATVRGPFRGPVAGTLSSILVHMNSAKTIALLTKNRPAGPGCRPRFLRGAPNGPPLYD